MLEFLEQIGNASIWPFWVPVLGWTGVAGAGALLLARARGLHPLAGYRMRQAVLLALPVSVLAAPWMPSLWAPPIWAPALGIANDMVATVGLATPSITPTLAGAVDTTTVPPTDANLTAVILGLATVAVVLLAVTRLAVLGADLRQLRRLRLFAPPVDDPAPRRMLRELSEKLGVRRPVGLLEGPPDSAPLTFGAWRPVIVVPHALLDSPRSLRTVLAHELVHIRRADYCWALLDQLTAAAFAFHPLVWLLRRGIERSRETSCDAEVLARGFVRPKPYAELLAHTHTPTQFPMPAVAASLSAPSLKLKERLETMKNFAHKRLTSRQHVGIVLGAGLVCLVVAIAGACATRAADDAPGGWEAIAQAVASNGEISAGVVTRLSDETGISESEVLTRLRESVEIFEIEGSPQGPYFTIPRLNDESISYYYNATEEDVLLELNRLDVQIQYLQEQIDETMATLDRLAEPGREAERFWVGTEEYETYSRAAAPVIERLDFLKSMRAERVRMSEVLKLEGSPQLTGCYDVTVGEWVVESYPLFRLRRIPVPSERGDSTDYEIPPRIEFAGPSDPPSSGTAIVVPEGALPSVHAYMSGEIIGDSLDLGFSTGYAGVAARLVRSGEAWVGTARTFIDVSPYPVHARPVTLTPVACDTPPPVSIEELQPPLARSVELEDGLVITLGEPLPESLEAEPESTRPAGTDSIVTPPWDWQLVTGRTRGLFSTTEWIAVLLNRSQKVTQVRLVFPDADAYEVLDRRLRGEYGAPRSSTPVRSRYANRISYLRLSRLESGGAEILLFL